MVSVFTPDCSFPPAAGYTVRVDFSGGEISSDLGALILGAVDSRIGLIDRLTAAIADSRDARYITHTLRDLLTQRVFKFATGRAPLDTRNSLVCGATHSRLEGALNGRDIYRMARALVLQFIAGYRCAPASITLDASNAWRTIPIVLSHGKDSLIWRLLALHFLRFLIAHSGNR